MTAELMCTLAFASTMLCCHCRKRCRYWLSTRLMSMLGTRTGRHRCTWRLPTRQWSARRSSSPCWVASMSLTEAGGQHCTMRLWMATLRQVVWERNWWLVDLFFQFKRLPAMAGSRLSPISLTPRNPVAQLLSKLWQVFYLQKQGSGWKVLCRTNMRGACRLGELAMPQALATRVCPGLFWAWVCENKSGRMERRENWWIPFILKKCSAVWDPVSLLF